MMEELKNRVISFSVYNQYTADDEIVEIGLALCKKYGWNAQEIQNSLRKKHKAWEFTNRAATEHKDIYAIATVMFLKEYSPKIEQVGYAIIDDSLALEMVEILEGMEQKDAFTYFLIGKANFAGRGAEIDFERALYCFNRAADDGIEIARLFAFEIEEKQEEIFALSSKLIKSMPNNHIIRFYLAYCYYHGHGTKPNYERVVELVGYTGDIANDNGKPIDYYFLASRYLLGLCHFHGFAVERDVGLAEQIFKFSAARYNPEAWYCQAISSILLGKKNSRYVWELLEKSAVRGYLPAVRKVMLCLSKGYGTEKNEELYSQYLEYYEHEIKVETTISDLGYEADRCDLVDESNNIIKDN